MTKLTSIKGISKTKAEIIIAYCGSIENAAKKGSMLQRGAIPCISKKLSTTIFNELNK
jgi:ribosomal protein S13